MIILKLIGISTSIILAYSYKKAHVVFDSVGVSVYECRGVCFFLVCECGCECM